jgi:hypothetical protein
VQRCGARKDQPGSACQNRSRDGGRSQFMRSRQVQ